MLTTNGILLVAAKEYGVAHALKYHTDVFQQSFVEDAEDDIFIGSMQFHQHNLEWAL